METGGDQAEVADLSGLPEPDIRAMSNGNKRGIDDWRKVARALDRIELDEVMEGAKNG